MYAAATKNEATQQAGLLADFRRTLRKSAIPREEAGFSFARPFRDDAAKRHSLSDATVPCSSSRLLKKSLSLRLFKNVRMQGF